MSIVHTSEVVVCKQNTFVTCFETTIKYKEKTKSIDEYVQFESIINGSPHKWLLYACGPNGGPDDSQDDGFSFAARNVQIKIITNLLNNNKQ